MTFIGKGIFVRRFCIGDAVAAQNTQAAIHDALRLCKVL